MSRQELLEKSVHYLEKMTPERAEEAFHYIEYLYFKYETAIPQVNNFQMLLLDGPTWTDEDNDYFSEQSQNSGIGELYDIARHFYIDYYRKKDKKDTLLFRLSETNNFSISAVTKYELLAGTKPDKISFTLSIIQNMKVLELNEKCIDIAIEIFNELKSKNQIIEVPDIFIGATAIHNKLPIATLNTNHFDRIPNLRII